MIQNPKENSFVSNVRMKKAQVVSELERSTLMEKAQRPLFCFCFFVFVFCFFFFSHKMANSNRKKSVDSLLIDGTVSTNWVEISGHFVQFYKKLYTKQFSWRPLLDGLLL
jgi:hypothetical protein